MLGDALVGLIQEKKFEDITVQQVLDRAGVSRSTFYAHYTDKNDLFLSDAEEFFEWMAFHLSRRREPSNRIVPVRELFAHVAEWHKFHAALVASGKVRDMMELAEGYFARGIEQRLGEMPRASTIAAERRAVVAHTFAGALISLLNWWLSHRSAASPERMDDLFHSWVWAGISTPRGYRHPADRG